MSIRKGYEIFNFSIETMDRNVPESSFEIVMWKNKEKWNVFEHHKFVRNLAVWWRCFDRGRRLLFVSFYSIPSCDRMNSRFITFFDWNWLITIQSTPNHYSWFVIQTTACHSFDLKYKLIFRGSQHEDYLKEIIYHNIKIYSHSK